MVYQRERRPSRSMSHLNVPVAPELLVMNVSPAHKNENDEEEDEEEERIREIRRKKVKEKKSKRVKEIEYVFEYVKE